MSSSQTIGILAVQGDFEAHARMFEGAGAKALLVRRPDELDEVDALSLPGGESTAMLKLLEEDGFFEALRRVAKTKPVFATCAGLILLASEVTGPPQQSLGLIDVSVERNAFGRQVHSFLGRVSAPAIEPNGLEAVFIRAPRIRRVGAEVEVLGHWNDEPVLVRQGRILALTFHPELTASDALARYFLDSVAS